MNPRKTYLLQTLLLFSATLFSVMALHNARRWHPDEAFYMTIARNAAVNGDWWLLGEPLDKPPLTYYLNALSLVAVAVDSDANGVLQLDVYKGEFAGRLPALFASVLLVAVVLRFTKAFTGDEQAANFAAWIVALSPLRIVFSPTAFTDMPMLLLALFSLWMAARGRPVLAGMWLVLSLWAKPQSVFYVPLLLALLQHRHQQHSGGLVAAVRFLLPVLAGLLLLALWDLGRVSLGAQSFYLLGQSRYTTTALTPLADYPLRLGLLWDTLQFSLGHGILTALVGLWIGLSAIASLATKTRLLPLLWVVAFCGVHILLTLNTFDRNLIVVLPLLAVVAAQMVVRPWMRGLLLVCMLPFALVASMGAYPIGGDDGRHDGIDQLAAYLDRKPVATVIYDRWLDWELDYYLGQWTNKRRVYYPTPPELIAGANALDERGTRYFVAPRWQAFAGWVAALEAAGYQPQLVYERDQFVVYSLSPPD